VGIDAGRQSHHAAAVDEHGQVQWSMRVSNDQDAITALLGQVETGDEVSWAVDLIGCETALLRAVLLAAGHQVIYVPGRTVKSMSGAFAGEAKTDARDAVVIANTARMRRDLTVITPPTELVARVTCTGRSATTAGCGTCATCPHRPRSRLTARTGPTTSANALKGASISRL
jgi:transposase